MSQITIASFPYTLAAPPYTTGDVRLRVWFAGAPGSQFVDADGNIVPLGNATSFYREIACTVAANVITVPTFTLPATDNSSNISVVARAQFYVNSAPAEFLFSDWIITATLGSSTTFAALYTFNLAVSIPYTLDPTYLTAPQVAALVAATNAGSLLRANNLSDVISAATARTNLGLGGAALLNVGTTAGTVAAGNDSRFPSYNILSFGADPTGVADSAVAIRAAITANETAGGGGEVIIPEGTFLLSSASGGALATIAKNVSLRSSGAKLKVAASVGVSTDVFLVKPAAAYIMDNLRINGVYIEPVSGTPARDAFRFDTTNSTSQIRNLFFTSNVVKQLGGTSLRSVSNHVDAFFCNYFGQNWLFGAPKFGSTGTDAVGDTIILQGNTITSLVVDDLMEINSNGSTVELLNNNITVAVVLHQAAEPIIQNNIIELANPALTSSVTEMLRLRGDVATIQSGRILNNYFIGESTHAVRAIRLDAVDNTYVDGNAYSLNAAAKFMNVTAGNLTVLGPNNRSIPGGLGGDGIEGAGYTSTDTFFGQIAKLAKQPASVADALQQGSLYVTGQVFAGTTGASGGGFGFGANKPQIEVGTGDPSGSVNRVRNSIWIRDDAAGIFINTTAGTGTTWTQLAIP